MNKRKSGGFRRFLVELLSVFLGVTLAFALNQWNENRKTENSQNKLLIELKNGLKLDLEDVLLNTEGNRRGMRSAELFMDLLSGVEHNADTTYQAYRFLWRNFISIQNRSAYESLKSKGLEIIDNDELRNDVIALYDFHFEILEKIEEHYSEVQYFENYQPKMMELMVENIVFDERGIQSGFNPNFKLKGREKQVMLEYLNRLYFNREFVIRQYLSVQEKIESLISKIDQNLAKQ